MPVSVVLTTASSKTELQMISPPGEPLGPEDARPAAPSHGAGSGPGSGTQTDETLFKCDHCHRSFTRPSHLSRHQLTHLPPSRRSIIPCALCGRSFSRQDVLLRHMRAAHDVDVGTRSTYQKSCHRCVQKKLKCDREIPCRSCSVAAADTLCQYPSVETTTDVRLSPESSAPDQNLVHANGAASSQSNSDSAPPSVQHYGGSDFLVLPAPPSSTVSNIAFSTDGRNPPFPSVPPFSAAESVKSCVKEFDLTSYSLPDVSQVPEFSVSSASVGYTRDTGMAGTNQQLTGPPTSNMPPIDDAPATEPWPFDQGYEPVPSHCPLPPIREVLQYAVRKLSHLEDTPLLGLAQLFGEYHLRKEETLDTEGRKGLQLLIELVELFFIGFQTIQPMLHVPTWKLNECPTMMLAAMACIGASLSKRPDAAELAASISDICAGLINSLVISNDINYSNIWYIATLCLHQIYSLGSGNQHLYQNADRTRGVLIGSLRGMGLLKPRLRLYSEIPDAPPQLSDYQCMLADWLSWAEQERDRRIAWAAFEYDCSLCTLTGRRGVVDLGELPSVLPCADKLWEAQSARVWADRRAKMTPNAMGAPLFSVVQTVIAGHPAPDDVSLWAKRIASQAIGRQVWDMKQMETVCATDYFGLPNLLQANQQGKADLLLGMDTLMASMIQAATTSDLVSYSISGLLCHYSHLYAEGEMLDLVLYIVRNIASRGTHYGDDIDLARHRLTEALASDPQRSRMLLWHAGQIVAIGNEHLVSAPCEMMRLFMGYAFILAFVKYCPPWSRENRPTIQLDCPGHATSQQHQVAEWIHGGGPATIGSTKDIFADGATYGMVQDAQTMLLRMRGWGLSEKFARILQCFEASDK